MHVQPARRLRHVPVAQLVDPLDVLPPHPVGRHRVLGRRRKLVPLAQQRRDHLVRVGGLREVVDRAHLHRRHGRRDRTVPGQDDHTAVLAPATDRLDHVEAIAVPEPQVDHGEGRRTLFCDPSPVVDAFRRLDRESALLHRPRKTSAECLVVVDDQKGVVLADIGQWTFGHRCHHGVLLRLLNLRPATGFRSI